jgi:hypothetical protein
MTARFAVACPSAKPRLASETHRVRSRKPSNTRLTLIEASRWTMVPQQGLEQLRALSRIDEEAVRALNGLVGLVAELCAGQFPAGLRVDVVLDLTDLLEAGRPVDEEHIDKVDAWLKEVGALLRRTPRQAYGAAVGRLVSKLETLELQARLANAPAITPKAPDGA